MIIDVTLYGTFNQSNPEFGESAEHLNTYDLDLIVRQGDLLYKSFKKTNT